MIKIRFYEKPGCINNTKQKQILRAAGAELDVRNLLTESWNAERLAAFFKNKPVADWFNPSAPSIKAGLIDPHAMDARSALASIASDPLLIRRPLIEKGEFRYSGFAWPVLAILLQLNADESLHQDLENCPRSSKGAFDGNVWEADL